MTNAALRAEEARDLRTQLGALMDDEAEIIFMDTSPRRQIETVYSMQSGEEIHVLRYHLPEIMGKQLPDGRPAFTARKELAPVYRQGSTPCFMADNSPEREALNELGIFKICPAKKLANNYAKQVHAQHKHHAEWAMYQDHVNSLEQADWKRRQEEQTAAIMKLAEGNAATQEKRGPGRPPKVDGE